MSIGQVVALRHGESFKKGVLLAIKVHFAAHHVGVMRSVRNWPGLSEHFHKETSVRVAETKATNGAPCEEVSPVEV